MDLFDDVFEKKPVAEAPLADRMRPRSLSEFVGQDHLLGPGKLLRELAERGELRSLLLWGPPGSGKTTLAQLLARSADAACVHFSSVTAGVKELKKIFHEAQDLQRLGKRTVLFVDEIHHLNKSQQDNFLPYVEQGALILIGATTENPSFEVIAPLLSRCPVLVLHALSESHLGTIVDGALSDAQRGLGAKRLSMDPSARAWLVQSSHGDARAALNYLESAAAMAPNNGTVTLAHVQEAAQRKALRYDKAGEEHYNVISAFIKSLRGSDPDAAIYWMMRMLEAGEDPLFIARRMVIFAAEDIGNADPRALSLAVAAKDAVHFVGLPEGRIPLAQVATYLASAPKSNASYAAMQAATNDVEQRGALPVPLHLRNAPTNLMDNLGYGKGYKYAHDFPDHIVAQEHLPKELEGKKYYFPSDSGEEKQIKERLAEWEEKRKGRAD
jgi:putative ATPase